MSSKAKIGSLFIEVSASATDFVKASKQVLGGAAGMSKQMGKANSEIENSFADLTKQMAKLMRQMNAEMAAGGKQAKNLSADVSKSFDKIQKDFKALNGKLTGHIKTTQTHVVEHKAAKGSVFKPSPAADENSLSGLFVASALASSGGLGSVLSALGPMGRGAAIAAGVAGAGGAGWLASLSASKERLLAARNAETELGVSTPFYLSYQREMEKRGQDMTVARDAMKGFMDELVTMAPEDVRYRQLQAMGMDPNMLQTFSAPVVFEMIQTAFEKFGDKVDLKNTFGRRLFGTDWQDWAVFLEKNRQVMAEVGQRNEGGFSRGSAADYQNYKHIGITDPTIRSSADAIAATADRYTLSPELLEENIKAIERLTLMSKNLGAIWDVAVAKSSSLFNTVYDFGNDAISVIRFLLDTSNAPIAYNLRQSWGTAFTSIAEQAREAFDSATAASAQFGNTFQLALDGYANYTKQFWSQFAEGFSRGYALLSDITRGWWLTQAPEFVRDGLERIRNAFSSLTDWLGTQWSGLNDTIAELAGTPHLSKLLDFAGKLRDAFRDAKDAAAGLFKSDTPGLPPPIPAPSFAPSSFVGPIAPSAAQSAELAVKLGRAEEERVRAEARAADTAAASARQRARRQTAIDEAAARQARGLPLGVKLPALGKFDPSNPATEAVLWKLVQQAFHDDLTEIRDAMTALEVENATAIAQSLPTIQERVRASLKAMKTPNGTPYGFTDAQINAAIDAQVAAESNNLKNAVVDATRTIRATAPSYPVGEFMGGYAAALTEYAKLHRSTVHLDPDTFEFKIRSTSGKSIPIPKEFKDNLSASVEDLFAKALQELGTANRTLETDLAAADGDPLLANMATLNAKRLELDKALKAAEASGNAARLATLKKQREAFEQLAERNQTLIASAQMRSVFTQLKTEEDQLGLDAKAIGKNVHEAEAIARIAALRTQFQNLDSSAVVKFKDDDGNDIEMTIAGMEAYIQKVAEVKRSNDVLAEGFNAWKGSVAELADAFGTSLNTAMTQGIRSFSAFKGELKDMADNLGKVIQQMLIQRLIVDNIAKMVDHSATSIANAATSSKSGGGGILDILAAMGRAAVSSSFKTPSLVGPVDSFVGPSLPAGYENRAQGGSTLAGRRYAVAEYGPELYTENGNTFLIPNANGRVYTQGPSTPSISIGSTVIDARGADIGLAERLPAILEEHRRRWLAEAEAQALAKARQGGSYAKTIRGGR